MNLYETGGVPPVPPYMQDRLCQCPLGHVYVGVMGSACPECGKLKEEKPCPGPKESP